MASDRWTTEEGPAKTDQYEWRLPNNEDQHGEQTVAPGDLMIKPKDLALVPTNAPTRSGVQHGQHDWNFTNAPDSNWYVLADSIETSTKTAAGSVISRQDCALPGLHTRAENGTSETLSAGSLVCSCLACCPEKPLFGEPQNESELTTSSGVRSQITESPVRASTIDELSTALWTKSTRR